MIVTVENMRFVERTKGWLVHHIDAWLTKDKLKKWMRLANFVKENENPCLSRQIGVIIVDPRADVVVSTGHNGPPQDLPACDDSDYLQRVVLPQLGNDELKCAVDDMGLTEKERKDIFVQRYANCGTCPRKLIGALSGQRLELCTCIHGETDAIAKAGRNLSDCWMVCACGVPCIECTKVILESRLEAVVALDHGKGTQVDYSPYSSRWMFEKSEKTKLILVPSDWPINSD